MALPTPWPLALLEPIGHLAHVLDAAGDGHVDHAGAHQAGGQVGGLLRRAALGVDRGGGHLRGAGPAVSHAVRATLNDCMPIWLTQPPTTWPTSAGRCPSAR